MSGKLCNYRTLPLAPSPFALPPRSLTTTLAPLEAKNNAYALPNPPPAPVTTTVWSSNLNCCPAMLCIKERKTGVDEEREGVSLKRDLGKERERRWCTRKFIVFRTFRRSSLRSFPSAADRLIHVSAEVRFKNAFGLRSGSVPMVIVAKYRRVAFLLHECVKSCGPSSMTMTKSR